ncbi:MAG: uracil-DNA glycosylase [bacterium]|nr:uracil-DNA glycosylase [bacterium]
MNKEEKGKLMRKIEKEILNNKKLPLYKDRIKNKNFPVIGEGSHSAKIMFIGEAPGKNEAATGRPFCGASGKFLDELLAHVGIKREDVYITNIVKDRPPGNRDPLPEEIESYSRYLDRQIDIIRPKVIATLGRFSMVYIMKKFGLDDKLDLISKIHGKVFSAEGGSASGGEAREIKIIPFYHPAVAIYNALTKDELKKDFAILKKFSK